MFKSKVEQEQFLSHLRYLLSLCDRQQRKRPDFKEMRRLLTLDGHWKSKPRGKNGIKKPCPYGKVPIRGDTERY
jgi:hypothetical protein